MNLARLSLLFVLITSMGFAQSPLDSILSKMQDRDLILLNKQLYQLVDHSVLRRINPDENTWPDLTANIANRAVARAKSFKPAARVMVAAHMAEVLSRSKQISLGYTMMNAALRGSENMQGQPKAYVYYKYAEIFRRLNRIDSAIYYAERVLDISHEIKNDSIEKVSLDQVAMLCYHLRNDAKAEYYFKMLTKHPRAGPHERKNYFNNIGLTMRRRSMYDSAIQYFKKALTIVGPADTAWVGLLNGNIGYTYYLQRDYDKALEGLLKDLDYSFRSRSTNSAQNALITITAIYISKKNLTKSRLFYDSLASQMKRYPEKNLLLDFYKISSDYYRMLGNLSKSASFLESYILLNDSMTSQENLARGSELEARFDFERQIKKIETLEMQNQLAEDESKQKNFFLVGTFIFSLLGAGLIYVLYRSNLFKNYTNNLLQEQNRQISQQASRLNELNNTKDKLFTIIGHDLRGPITSLRGMMGLVKKDIVSKEEFDQFSEQLQNNVEYVHFTLDNLLHWSKNQMQGILAKPVKISIRALTDENFNLLGETARGKDIKLINKVAMDAEAYADLDQIRMVIRNLMSNAIKFTESGGSVTVSCKSEGGRKIVTVKDTGMGIPDDIKANLFQMNNNYSSSGTKGERGTGLGLSLCKEMLDKNNGEIWVESEPGFGTSFHFSIPEKQPVS